MGRQNREGGAQNWETGKKQRGSGVLEHGKREAELGGAGTSRSITRAVGEGRWCLSVPGASSVRWRGNIHMGPPSPAVSDWL